MDVVDYGYKIENGRPNIESLENLVDKYQKDFFSTGNFEAAAQMMQYAIQNLSMFFSDNYENF